MNRWKNAWRPTLLGMVLMSVLVGVVGAMPTEKPSALSASRQLVIAAADFYPAGHTVQYSNPGGMIGSTLNATAQTFLAPVDFPVPYYATIDKLELFGYDGNGAAHIVVDLCLSKPSAADVDVIATIDTGITYSDPGTDPRWWQETYISPNVKNPANDAFVRLKLDDDTNLWVYGVRIWYRAGK